VTNRRDREQERLEKLEQEEEDERRAETQRRGEQLREAWRQHHPQEEDREKDRSIMDHAESGVAPFPGGAA
jgi:hypothetical protein